MNAPDRQHDVGACARAWQTLRLAHDRVARRLDAALARDCDLGLHEFDVLLYLRSHGGEEARIGGLLKAVPLSQPALSRLVARLAQRGLLVRSAAEGDRRAVVVRLTETGTALIDRAIGIHARVVRETLTGKLSDAEQAALLQLLSQVGR